MYAQYQFHLRTDGGRHGMTYTDRQRHAALEHPRKGNHAVPTTTESNARKVKPGPAGLRVPSALDRSVACRRYSTKPYVPANDTTQIIANNSQSVRIPSGLRLGSRPQVQSSTGA